MIYSFNYRSQYFGDYVTLEIVHNGHNPIELYRYAYKEIFGISDEDNSSDVLTIDTSNADDVPTDDIENNSDGDLIPF